jgi:uncharacterized protein (TIGR02246 family)
MSKRTLLCAGLASVAALLLPATLSAQKLSVDQRLQRLEDERAIQHILVDYAANLDFRDYDGYAALFAEAGEWTNANGSHKGRAAIRKMLADTLGPAGAPNRTNFHIISNGQVSVQGDRASAISRYLFVMRAPDGRPQPALAGIYRDELVRTAQGWKISRRVADDLMPTAEEWRKIIAAQGERK